MLGDKDLLGVAFGQKTSFMGEIQETSNFFILNEEYVEILEQKDNEIKSLKRTIKKLEKQLKTKNQMINVPQTTEGKNSYFKTVIQREVSRYNQLKKVISSITSRVKKLSSDIDQQVSISQNSETMGDLVQMLEKINMSKVKSSLQSESSSFQYEETEEVDSVLDRLEISMRGLLLKYGETNKNYKQTLSAQKFQQQDLISCKSQLKKQRKTRDLLQKLLQKNETERNDLVNQINMCANQRDMQELRTKTKEQILMYACKLNYRIRDLELQKDQYMKSNAKQLQRQMKLYQQLVDQVKSVKEKAKMRQSVA